MASPLCGVDTVTMTDKAQYPIDTRPWIHNTDIPMSLGMCGVYDLNWSTVQCLFTSFSVLTSKGNVGIASQGLMLLLALLRSLWLLLMCHLS